jgi:copper resistance protein C
VRRRSAVVLGGLCLALAPTSPALAHSGLVSSLPAQDAQLATSPPAVELVFDEPVSTRFSRVEVTGPDGRTWSAGEPEVSGSTVTLDLAELGPAGTYEVAYRVVSADGHPVSGTRSFALTAAGDGTPPAAPAAADGSSGPGAVPLAGAGLLLAAGAGVVVHRRTRAEHR